MRHFSLSCNEKGGGAKSFHPYKGGTLRVAKCWCPCPDPCVLEDQKMSEVNQKWRPGCPPD